MNFSVVLLLACVVAYVTILVGGRGTREVGWKILSPMLAVVALVQLIAMSLVVSAGSQWGKEIFTNKSARPEYMRTITASLWVGFWTSRSFSAP